MVTTQEVLPVRDVPNSPRVGHRFQPGNKHGKGSPNGIRQAAFRRQFMDAVADGTIPALARKLQVDALKGDEFAIRTLLDYCLGKPTQAVELSGPDGESLGPDGNQIITILLGLLAGPEYMQIRIDLADQLEALGHDGG